MRAPVLVIASLWVACASSGSDQRSDNGRGTEACRIWQDAACDHYADRCSAIARDTCDQQYQAVTCRSDSVAERCTDQLESADCGEATADCLIDSVADTKPATDACEMLVDHFCERATTCGKSSSMDQCLMDSTTLIQCEKAVGYRLDFDQCLDEIANMDCDVLTLPAICRDVILARE